MTNQIEPIGDSRIDFNESWLSEMPSGIGQIDTYDFIAKTIKERIAHGAAVIDLSNGLRKIDGSQTKFYWYQDGMDIVLAAELSVQRQALVVNVVGKNANYKGQAPFAADLYDAILKDSDVSIRLMSDRQLSDDGYAIWKRLFALGHKISVYDRKEPGTSYTTFTDASEMDQFFKHHDDTYKRYQFVLSESAKFGETLSFFRTRRMRELSGLL
jgi:hypothetical protein